MNNYFSTTNLLNMKCEHKSSKYNCIECYPKAFCEHKRKKAQCKKCGGSQICKHNRRKHNCKQCFPDSFCEHNRRRERCSKCGTGNQLCKHNRDKYVCKDCNGKGICEHKQIRTLCIKCDGSGICEHKKRRYECKDCNGNGICEHNKLITVCKDCKGCRICEHNRDKKQCYDCNPALYFVYLQSKRIRSILNNLDRCKDKRTTEYLGCSKDFFYNHINNQLTNEMKEQGFHIDHIKPVSKFNLKNEKELKQCCHYTNLQPLLEKDNLSKSNKWSEEDEINWRNNIIQKDLL